MGRWRWVGGGKWMDRLKKRDESREKERSAQTTFTGGRACRHNGGAVGQWLVLGFTGSTSLLPSAWAWRE